MLKSPEKADNKDFEKIAFKGDLFRNITLNQGGTRFDGHLFCPLKACGSHGMATFGTLHILLQLPAITLMTT